MGKTFVIPDIHGRYDLLVLALKVIEEYDGGTVVFLGDYIDRGPDSESVVTTLIKGPTNENFKWVTLMGNHESMMVEALSGDNESMWLVNGGFNTLDSYERVLNKTSLLTHRNWMSKLPKLYHDKHRVYVHASVDPELPLSKQNDVSLLWARYHGWDVGYKDKHVVHGHTPKQEPELLVHRTNLDVGAVYSGRLPVAYFEDDKPGGPVDIHYVYGKDYKPRVGFKM